VDINIDKKIIRQTDIALRSVIHEYRTSTVNERVMIENYSLELIRTPESIHSALSINLGTVFNKQCCPRWQNNRIDLHYACMADRPYLQSNNFVRSHRNLNLRSPQIPIYMFKYACHTPNGG